MRTFHPRSTPEFGGFPTASLPVPTGPPTFALKPGDEWGGVTATTTLRDLWWRMLLSIAARRGRQLYGSRSQPDDLLVGGTNLGSLLRPVGYSLNGNVLNVKAVAITTPRTVNTVPTKPSWILLTQSALVTGQLFSDDQVKPINLQREFTAFYHGSQAKGHTGILLGPAPEPPQPRRPQIADPLGTWPILCEPFGG